jgi:hypothetical protein
MIISATIDRAVGQFAMRLLVVAMFVPSCAGPEPGGVWPSSMTAFAVTSGDTNRDGNPDLVVLGAINGSEDRIFVVDGSADLALDATTPIKSFTNSARSSLGLSVLVVGELVVALVAVSDDGDGPPLVTLVSMRATDLTGLATRILSTHSRSGWLQTVTLGNGDAFLMIGLDDELFSLPVDALADSRQDALHRIPPPLSVGAWAYPKLVLRYSDGPMKKIAVTTDAAVYTSLLPGTDTGPFDWVTVRDDSSWFSQIGLDVTNDGQPEVVGVAPQPDPLDPLQICALSLATGEVGCMQTGGRAGQQVFLLAPDQESDLLMLSGGGGESAAQLSSHVSLSGTVLTAEATEVMPLQLFGLLPIAIQQVARVLIVEGSGRSHCVSTSGGLHDCAP